MPIHDWTRASAGIFHSFHNNWITFVMRALNNGILPKNHYAISDQITSGFGPEDELEPYAAKARTIVIRHTSEDRIVAMLEIVSPGNKNSQYSLDQFVDKVVKVLRQSIHFSVIDLFPPGPRDPQGIHGVIWQQFNPEPFTLPADKRLTLAAYSAGPIKEGFIEPVAVGDALPDLPLFLNPGEYVEIPLETTYLETWSGMPERWRTVLERG